MKQETKLKNKEEMFEQFFHEPELKELLKEYFMWSTNDFIFRDITAQECESWQIIQRNLLNSFNSYVSLRCRDYRDKINFKEGENTHGNLITRGVDE